MKDTVMILGTEYELVEKDFNDPELKEKNRVGYCFYHGKQIVYANVDTIPEWKGENSTVRNAYLCETLRHEIIHAFLFESGMGENSSPADSWAMNEEMVDWFSKQWPKISQIFNEAEISL